MSGLLTLARDYLERMANPVYGFATNEEYSLRFGDLLESEGFEDSLREEILKLRDTGALTSNGWLWLIGWARSRRIDLPEDLLFELYERWSSMSARCAITDLATYGSQILSRTDVTLADFPSRFLARIMRRATQVRETPRPGIESLGTESPRLTERAEKDLIVFLQVGTPVAIAAASTLLRHRWQGHEQLFSFFRILVDALDAETRHAWGRKLHLDLTME